MSGTSTASTRICSIDVDIKGKKVPALVHFDRNGFGYTLNRETGELLVAREVRSESQLGHARST